ncbi:MAG: phosphate ABC transporter substrate-binding protein [Planctomycetota bacterium]|jgi:phosphate transport system substrate-binding protein
MKKLGIALVVLSLVACGRRSAASRRGIQNKGSDTLVNVALAWAEAYKEVNPDIGVAVTGGGSGTGISALINGTVDVANSSRRMKPKEVEMARARGVEPVEFIVGYDALAVYVHPNNPIESFTLAQLAEIYGEGGATDSWEQLGVTVPGCSSSEIIRVSRQNNSGTYVYFKDAVLGKERDYRLGSRDMHGSKDVVELVMHTPCALGYSGFAYATPEVRFVPVAAQEGDTPVEPSVDAAIDGSYPIARPLFMYTAGQPEGEIKAYIDWILSDEGQCIILRKGYAPARPVSCE